MPPTLVPIPIAGPTDGWRIGQAPAGQQRSLPAPRMASEAMVHPEGYIADPALNDAIHAAIILGQPLLITGEPGCGKTEVANYIAYQFGLAPPSDGGCAERTEWAFRFDTKSTTAARDLFYSYDVVGRFNAKTFEPAFVGARAADDAARFIRFHALGRAILDGAAAADVAGVAGTPYARAFGAEAVRRVVLIDEIDKAPLDVPNDLLMEIERYAFYVAELDVTVRAQPDARPVVVFTSNSQRSLPEAFLRRCVYYAMPFPAAERLAEIVARRIAEFPATSPLLTDAIRLLMALRDYRLQKKPGTAELLGFLHALLGYGCTPGSTLPTDGVPWFNLARQTLLKVKEDQDLFDNETDLAVLLERPTG